ncbi:MAG: hypothetical protein O2861_10985 [Proteobacteria bacterium]|nr:hypothetical protein [Pseudomonadota bacterium]
MISSQEISRTNYLTAVLLLVICAHATAQDDFFSTIDVDIEESSDRGPLEFLGWVNQKIAYGFQAPGPLFSRSDKEINRIETSLFGQVDVEVDADTAFRFGARMYHDEVYRWFDDTPYHPDEINEFRNRYEIRDFYLEHQYENGVYFKIGNQMQVWGMAEYLRVTDLVNIENQFALGQQDLEDLRLQVPALQLSFNLGDWAIDNVVTKRAGRNLLSPNGDEFDQFILFRRAGFAILEESVEHDSEYFLRASTQFSQGDLQIVASEFNDNGVGLQRLEALQSAQPQAIFRQNRMRAFGFSANWVEGSWLVFGEFGIHEDRQMQSNQATLLNRADGWEERDQVLGVFGVEYNGIRDLLLTLELDGVHTKQHEDTMLVDRTQLGGGLRAYWTPLNERVQVLAVWNELVNIAGRVVRISADYNWSDNLDFGLLWVSYDLDQETPFAVYEFNDVFQLQLRYSFQL